MVRRWFFFVAENIIELLRLLLESSAGSLRNFGWPECSVDQVLQTVLLKCGKEPASSPGLDLLHRLKVDLFFLLASSLTAGS